MAITLHSNPGIGLRPYPPPTQGQGCLCVCVHTWAHLYGEGSMKNQCMALSPLSSHPQMWELGSLVALAPVGQYLWHLSFFIHLVNKYLLKAYCVPGTMLRKKNRAHSLWSNTNIIQRMAPSNIVPLSAFS